MSVAEYNCHHRHHGLDYLHQSLLLFHKLPPNLSVIMLMTIMLMMKITQMLMMMAMVRMSKHLCLGIWGLCFEQLL